MSCHLTALVTSFIMIMKVYSIYMYVIYVKAGLYIICSFQAVIEFMIYCRR